MSEIPIQPVVMAEAPVEQAPIASIPMGRIARALEMIGVALLVQEGVMTIEEGRKEMGFAGYRQGETDRIRDLMIWSHDTGVVVPISWAPYWRR